MLDFVKDRDHAVQMKITLTAEQKIALEMQHRQNRDRRVCDRILCVLLCSEGWSPVMIAQSQRIDETTVRRHLNDWLYEEKLKPENGGSQRYLNETQAAELIAYLTDNTRTLTGYIVVFLYMVVPVEGILSALPAIAGARIAMQRVQQLRTGLSPEIPPKPHAAEPFTSLALENIHYQYQGEDGERFSLGPLSLTFTPGERVFIVGGNGSGKTTLANLLVGIFSADSGQLWLNGNPVAADDLQHWRQHFSVIFSDFFLFDDVAFVTDRTQEQVEHLLDLLKLSHKVSFHNGRISTVALSQGQRKRLALLQSWLEDRPIYLFDEWAADQDPEFKAVFYLELLPMLKAEGKTVIAITHDDRYFHLADRLIKLESGQIVEHTSPPE